MKSTPSHCRPTGDYCLLGWAIHTRDRHLHRIGLPREDWRRWWSSVANSTIDARYEFSPDGKHVADIRVAGKRVDEDGDGNTISMEWAGSVSIRATSGGLWERKELVANRGLHPPWGRIEGPLVNVSPESGRHRIDLYDRDSGERVVEIDVPKTTGLGGVYWPKILQGTDLIAFFANDPGAPLGDSLQAYVLVMNVVTQKVIAKIAVGPGPVFNIALTKREGFLRTLVSKTN